MCVPPSPSWTYFPTPPLRSLQYIVSRYDALPWHVYIPKICKLVPMTLTGHPLSLYPFTSPSPPPPLSVLPMYFVFVLHHITSIISVKKFLFIPILLIEFEINQHFVFNYAGSLYWPLNFGLNLVIWVYSLHPSISSIFHIHFHRFKLPGIKL